MDVGILFVPRRHPDEHRGLAEIYQDHIADVQYAEKLGFTHAWTSEHHFGWDQFVPGQFPLLAAVAARTSTIRIGTNLIVLPYHHPLRVAEDAAVLDILSGGRLELTVGAGSIDEEFHAFGQDPKDRFGQLYEGLDILLKCFSEDEFSHRGEYFDLPGVRMTTKPLQPKLPIWVGASGPVGVKRVARRGLNIAGAFGEMNALFDSELRANGFDPVNHGSMFVSMVHIADTEDQAWEEASRGIHHWLNFYGSQGWVGLQWMGGSMNLPDPAEMRHWDRSPFPYHVGTPEQVAESLMSQVQSTRNTNIALVFRQPFMDTRMVRRSMDLFAEHVLPAMRAWQHPTVPSTALDAS